MKPHIEYHFATFWLGSWHHQFSNAPVGTTFATIKAQDYPNEPTFVPTRLRWPAYAWPGGYEISYIVADGGVLCHHCANAELDRTLDKDDPEFYVIAQDINYEDPHLHCDHCDRQIEPAYACEEDDE